MIVTYRRCSGMGSSSAFTVGLLYSLYALRENNIKARTGLEAINIEQELIKEHVGSQDQTFAASWRLECNQFLSNGQIVVEPIIMKPDRLEDFESKFMLFFYWFFKNCV